MLPTWDVDDWKDMRGLEWLHSPHLRPMISRECAQPEPKPRPWMPRIYASFGCHPKATNWCGGGRGIVVLPAQAAWSYDDDFEMTMLDYMDACGRKPVQTWREKSNWIKLDA